MALSLKSVKPASPHGHLLLLRINLLALPSHGVEAGSPSLCARRQSSSFLILFKYEINLWRQTLG